MYVLCEIVWCVCGVFVPLTGKVGIHLLTAVIVVQTTESPITPH